METEKYATDMKKSLFVIATIVLAFSCTKEQPNTNKQDQDVPASEFQALKKEVEELKNQLKALTPGEGNPVVSVSEFEELKKENDQLKAQVEMLTSGFFEVDGLRFDKNGTLISVQKLESKSQQKVGSNTLTITRTYDAEGRVIEILRDYNTHSEFAGVPYFWQKTLYEYSGKNCKTTTQTHKYGLPAGTPYEEVITEATYW